MIKVTLRNIYELELPLDNTSKILERGTSKQVLKELEKKKISYMVFTNVNRVRKYDAKDNCYRKYCKMLKIKKLIATLVNHSIS